MLKTLFAEYKWVALGIAFLVYSVSVWNISTGYNNTKHVTEKLALTQETLRVTKANSELSGRLAQALTEQLAALETNNKAMTKELIDEIAQDPRFKSCRTTDGVRSALQRKLDSQTR